MALPNGWGETPNEWRVRLRDPKRFLHLRPKPFAGIKGVYVVGGPLKADDPDRHRHKALAYVVQGIRFKKSDWPSLTAAVGWLEASKFGGTIENPPRRDLGRFRVGNRVALHPATDAWMQGDRYGEVVGFTRGKRDNMGAIRRLVRVKLDSGRVRNFAESNLTDVVEQDRTENPPATRYSVTGHSAVGIRVPGPYSSKASIRWSNGGLSRVTIGEAIDLVGLSRMQDALDHPGKWIVIGQLRRDNPPGERRRVFGGKYELEQGEPYEGKIQGVVEQFIAYGKRGAMYGGLVWDDGRFHWVNLYRPLGSVPFDLAQVSPRVLWGDDTAKARAENPPRIHRGQLRMASFRAASAAAIEKLVATDAELSSLMAQALALVDRGSPVPERMRERARVLNLERRSQLEEVKTAVARQGAAIEEFSTPPAPGRARRENPARVKAEAIRLYESFHGHAPTGYHLERVPDLSQLVTLGRVLSIDYQLDPRNARGHRNTPYTHRFGPGSTLLTDPTGRALVVVGNVKVSRAPRGRFGYIREASGV